MSKDNKKKCFIIMPLTVHDDHLNDYRNDTKHWHHVLDHLFVPAIERAGLIPIKPIAKGAELIHAEIIRHLETDELTLCDMSQLNPNVFFELGVRTSLNLPICLVRDSNTPKVPFDMGLINHHTYDETLDPWVLEDEIDKLFRHLKETLDSNPNENAMWTYFGMTRAATPPSTKDGLEGKVDLIYRQLETMRRDPIRPEITFNRPPSLPSEKNMHLALGVINSYMKIYSYNDFDISVLGSDDVLLKSKEGLSSQHFDEINTILDALGIHFASATSVPGD